MFKFEAPVFVHKNILKKEMLEELRDYPLQISRLLFGGCGDGVLKGCKITWGNNILKVHPGLILYEGNIYRMEEEQSLNCPPADRLTFIKVRFVTMDYEKDYVGGFGDVYLDENPPELREMELGRFRLQEGARLRTVYENFEDYHTEFDTVNRIHMPCICVGSVGLWPELLMKFALELLETGTENVFDISFAMQILGAKGEVSQELVVFYVERSTGKKVTDISGSYLYDKLLHILRERRMGGNGSDRRQSGTKQILLL